MKDAWIREADDRMEAYHEGEIFAQARELPLKERLTLSMKIAEEAASERARELTDAEGRISRVFWQIGSMVRSNLFPARRSS